MIEFTSFFQIQPFYNYLRKQRENQKFLKSLEIGATFFLISFFLLFAIKPTVSTISSLLGEIKSKELLKQQMRDKINNIIQAQDSYLQVQDKYQLIDSSLPSRPEYNQLHTQIISASNKSFLDTPKIDYLISETTEDKSNIVAYKVNFSSQSNFLSNIRFLEKLQNLRRLVSIESINYSNPKKENQLESSSNVSINIGVNSFYLKQ